MPLDAWRTARPRSAASAAGCRSSEPRTSLCTGHLPEARGVAGDVDDRVEVRRIAGEPGQLQIDQAQRHLCRADVDPENQRPARGNGVEALLRRPVNTLPVLDDTGGVLQQHDAIHRTTPTPWAIAQFSSASASASLSSAGAKP